MEGPKRKDWIPVFTGMTKGKSPVPSREPRVVAFFQRSLKKSLTAYRVVYTILNADSTTKGRKSTREE
jgi:hypothetical protein